MATLVSETNSDHEVEFGASECGEKNYKYDHCQKNLGHTNMSRIRKVRIDDLPQGWRYPDLFLSIMKRSRLVVKITVPYISPNRPKKYPGFEHRGKWVRTVGTGRLIEPSGLALTTTDCPLEHCTVEKPHKTTPLFQIQTANHVVFDDEEARLATVDFFLDSEEDKGKNVVKCNGVKVLASFKTTDQCILLCISHDLDLLKKVNSLPPYVSLVDAELAPIPSFSERPQGPLIVIISHPHGHFKHVAFGTWIGYAEFDGASKPDDPKLQDYLMSLEAACPQWMETGAVVDDLFLSAQEIRNLKLLVEINPELRLSDLNPHKVQPLKYQFITYNAATCPGSSGAEVLILLPGHTDEPWVYTGMCSHVKHFGGSLNAGGSPVFRLAYSKDVETAIVGRIEMIPRGRGLKEKIH